MTALDTRLRSTLTDLMHWIASERLRATVIGGIAAGIQGQPRLTEDVDAVIFETGAEELLASGMRYGFEPRIDDALEFSRETRMLLMRHRSGVDVDLSLGGLPFEREVVERAQVIDAEGLRISVATPEDLIIMKALARRTQDVTDIAAIIEVQKHLDVDRIRHWVREFSAILEMPEILNELEALLRRRKR